MVEVTDFIEMILSADAQRVGTSDVNNIITEYFTGPNGEQTVQIPLDQPGITPSIGYIYLDMLGLVHLHPFLFPKEYEDSEE